MSAPVELVLFLALNTALALVAFARRALTPSGLVAAALVGGGVLWGGGLTSWALLGLFFITSTVLSGWRSAEKRAAVSLTGKTHRRDVWQVLANGGPALISCLAWKITGQSVFLVAAAAALAEANSDTWASEAGLLSTRPPRSILGFAPVPRGASGGVTFLGTVAAACGSLVIALGFGLGCSLAAGCPVLPPWTLLAVAAAGFSGSILDSVLGAGLQTRYRRAVDGAYTERSRGPEGERNRRTGGLPGVTNDVVNFASGLAAAAGVWVAFLPH